MPPATAIIAGAGPAGLTAAYELLKRTDIQPIVYEASDAIGGIAQTYNHKGNRIDIGGHRFFSKSDRVTQWWFNILPPQGKPAADTIEKNHEVEYAARVIVDYLCSDCYKGSRDQTVVEKDAPNPEKEDTVMLQRPRVSRIFFRKNFFPYPISITFSVARKLGLINTILIGLSYLWAQIFRIKNEDYLDAFLINRFGKRLYKTFFEDYTQKVWGVPCCEIKADWGAQRIKGLSLRSAIISAFKDLLTTDTARKQHERETSLITRFWYPKYGPGQMWETVAEHIQRCGGEVHLQQRISGLTLQQGRVANVTVTNAETGESTEQPCNYFFSSMPIKHLIEMLDPSPPSAVTEVAKGLQYRDFLTVGLLLRRLHVQERRKDPAASVPDNWIYVQDRGVQVGRIQVFNNWSPYMVADRKNTVWIGLEYFVTEGDSLWSMPDEEMITLGMTEMEQIGFCSKSDLLDACVLRMPKAYPSYTGTYDQLDIIKEHVQSIENLFLIGRNGMHRYNNQDHSMLSSMVAVDNIMTGRTDSSNLWEINVEQTYHEKK